MGHLVSSHSSDSLQNRFLVSSCDDDMSPFLRPISHFFALTCWVQGPDARPGRRSVEKEEYLKQKIHEEKTKYISGREKTLEVHELENLQSRLFGINQASVHEESHSALTQFTRGETPRKVRTIRLKASYRLSQHERDSTWTESSRERLHMDWVNAECNCWNINYSIYYNII